MQVKHPEIVASAIPASAVVLAFLRALAVVGGRSEKRPGTSGPWWFSGLDLSIRNGFSLKQTGRI
jgi:hypothetical protein